MKTAPFVTFWYCQTGAHRAALAKWWCEAGKDQCSGCKFKFTTARVPHRFRDSHDPTRRRLRKKQRDALARRREKALEAAAVAGRGGRGRGRGRGGRR